MASIMEKSCEEESRPGYPVREPGKVRAGTVERG